MRPILLVVFEDLDSRRTAGILTTDRGFAKPEWHQRAARYIAPDAHVVELGVLGAQTGLDVAQALAIGELAWPGNTMPSLSEISGNS